MLTKPIVLIFTIVTVAYSLDYCSEDLCDPGAKHIACNNNGKFLTNCPKDAVLVEFTDDLKQITLDNHNLCRDRIASGKEKGYEKAARMATLVWNDELAKLAEYNVKRCIFEHDKCRNTDKFLYAGQNLGQMRKSSKYPEAKELIKTIIYGWYEEHKDADMTYIDEFRHPDSGQMIGHFTQLIRDQAYAVGCAMARYKKDNWYTTLYACDYTLGNIEGYPIYDKSTKAASGCKSGKNKKYDGLCSIKEIYNNDLFYD